MQETSYPRHPALGTWLVQHHLLGTQEVRSVTGIWYAEMTGADLSDSPNRCRTIRNDRISRQQRDSSTMPITHATHRGDLACISRRCAEWNRRRQILRRKESSKHSLIGSREAPVSQKYPAGNKQHFVVYVLHSKMCCWAHSCLQNLRLPQATTSTSIMKPSMTITSI